MVKARLARDGAGLQLMVYLPDQKELFARICGFFGRAQLSILEAKIHTTRHGYALDTFVVHDPANPNASYREAISYIEFELKRVLTERPPLELPAAGRVSRHLRHFPLSPEVRIFPDDKGTHFILEIVAGDRPGLLARIAYMLAKANVNVASAKINTLGERAEDVFLLDGARLHDEAARLKLEHGALRTASGLAAAAYSSRASSPGNRTSVIAEHAHVAHAHRIEDAVQVVALVLDHAGVEAVRLAFDRPALRIEALVAQARVARHPAAQAGDRQAALPSFLGLVGQRRQHRIDQLGVGHRLGIGIAVVVLEAENDYAQPHADLRRGEAGAVSPRSSFRACRTASISSSGVPKRPTRCERCSSRGSPMRRIVSDHGDALHNTCRSAPVTWSIAVSSTSAMLSIEIACGARRRGPRRG